MTDFSKTLIRSSAAGVLFVEPKEKIDKAAGELSKTAKSFLIKIYIQEHWDRRKDIVIKCMEKGILCEDDAIKLVSEIEGQQFTKNLERKSNEFITGHADIITDDTVYDTKVSLEAETFLPKLVEPLDRMYYIQLQCYMWLYDKEKAKLCYCLVSAPDMLIQNERKKLLYNMDVISEESPEYKIAEYELLKNMIFDDIQPKERIISHLVYRDEEIIGKLPEKVTKAREFLAEFQKLHLK